MKRGIIIGFPNDFTITRQDDFESDTISLKITTEREDCDYLEERLDFELYSVTSIQALLRAYNKSKIGTY